MNLNLCVVLRCDEHRGEEGWLHVASRREHPVTAHLRPQERAA